MASATKHQKYHKVQRNTTKMCLKRFPRNHPQPQCYSQNMERKANNPMNIHNPIQLPACCRSLYFIHWSTTLLYGHPMVMLHGIPGHPWSSHVGGNPNRFQPSPDDHQMTMGPVWESNPSFFGLWHPMAQDVEPLWKTSESAPNMTLDHFARKIVWWLPTRTLFCSNIL